MSVEEAREILGEEYNKLSDEEIERIVSDLEVIASLTIKAIVKGEFRINDTDPA